MRTKLVDGFIVGLAAAALGLFFARDTREVHWLKFELTHRFSSNPRTQYATNPGSFFGWSLERAGGDLGGDSDTSQPHEWREK